MTDHDQRLCEQEHDIESAIRRVESGDATVEDAALFRWAFNLPAPKRPVPNINTANPPF
jgi:hypothetical protein